MHECKHLIIHCIDFRFGKAIKRYMEEKELLNDCDIVALAGATKGLSSPVGAEETEVLMGQIDISKKLHNMKEVILMNHMDCGAYGGHKAFPSINEERTHHLEEMAKAAVLINSKYPDLNIKKVLADINEAGEVAFVEVT